MNHAVIRRFVLAASLALVAVTSAGAAPVPFAIDKSRSAVMFSVSQLGFLTVHGQFHEFDADILLDPGELSRTSVALTMAAASVDTGWALRDRALRSARLLDVEVHPAIVFRSTEVERTGANSARLRGRMTMLGVTREEEFDVSLQRTPDGSLPRRSAGGDSPAGIERARFVALGAIDRTRYGLDFGRPLIGDVISVTVFLDIESQ